MPEKQGYNAAKVTDCHFKSCLVTLIKGTHGDVYSTNLSQPEMMNISLLFTNKEASTVTVQSDEVPASITMTDSTGKTKPIFYVSNK